MPRPADPVAAANSSATTILATLERDTFARFLEYYAWQYDKAALSQAIRRLGGEPPKRAKREDLLLALEHCFKAKAAARASAGPLPSYRPWVPRYEDGRLSEAPGAEAKDCRCFGMSGPCWGQTDLYEVRNMLVPGGRCLEARCMGHRGAQYRLSTLPEDR